MPSNVISMSFVKLANSLDFSILVAFYCSTKKKKKKEKKEKEKKKTESIKITHSNI
jgi:hypothetical protein